MPRNLVVEETAALLPDRKKQRQNRSLMCSGNAGDSANAHPFNQERHNLHGLLSIDVAASERPLARRRKRRAAFGATITLDSLSPVESESLYLGMLTFLAGHVGSPLVFSAGEADNQSLGFECGLRPRLDSALSSVSADGRVFNSSSHVRKRSCKQPLIKVITHEFAAKLSDSSSLSQALQCLMNESAGICVSIHVVSVKQQIFFHLQGAKRDRRTGYQAFNGLADAHLILHLVLPRLSFFSRMKASRQRPHKILQTVNFKVALVLPLNRTRKLLPSIFQGRFKIIRSHCSPATSFVLLIRNLLK